MRAGAGRGKRPDDGSGLGLFRLLHSLTPGNITLQRRRETVLPRIGASWRLRFFIHVANRPPDAAWARLRRGDSMTSEAAPAQAFRHSGKFIDVMGLAAKNALLTLLTFTLYRFWARTSMRRRLWSRVSAMGDPLEYTGTALELFRGFLIALPTFFLPAIFVYYIAPLALDPGTAGWLAFGFYLLAVPLIAAARYLMRRYQLSRTHWRGIRFGLAGSAAGFAFASSGWTVLQWLSLFWYTPVSRMNRAKLLWENARFGDQPFEFVEDGQSPQKDLWWPFALGWFGTAFAVPTVFGIVLSVGLAYLGLDAVASGEQATEPPPNFIAGVVIAYLIAVIGALLGYLLVWAPYNAAAMNAIAARLSLDGARFRLRAKTFSLFLVTLAGWIVTIFSIGLLAPIAGFLQVRYVINRFEILGEPRFAEIGQSIVSAPNAGEGLGDAFDLDMGVGVI